MDSLRINSLLKQQQQQKIQLLLHIQVLQHLKGSLQKKNLKKQFKMEELH